MSCAVVADGATPSTRSFANLLAASRAIRSDPKLARTVDELIAVAEEYEKTVAATEAVASLYDSKIGVRGNGFRSFVGVADKVVGKLAEAVSKLNSKHHHNHHHHNRIHQNLHHHLEEAEYWTAYAKKMNTVNGCAVEMHEAGLLQGGKLLPERPTVEGNEVVTRIAEKMGRHEDFSVFFGRGVGLHMNEPTAKVISSVLFFQAMYADIYDGHFASKVSRWFHSYGGIRYLLNSRALGKKAFENSKNLQICFSQDFFNATEPDLVHKALSKLVSASPKTNHLMVLPPEKIYIRTLGGELLPVPVPSTHVGPRNLPVRLVAPFRTPGMTGTCLTCGSHLCRCATQPHSRSIVFHVHGGGFVAHTSKSHVAYLTTWANKLQAPILSVDYSCAPEAQYPRPVEEVLYAYCWMRNNFGLLGTTGENVVLAGDSAGGNLVSGLAYQCLKLDLPRPDSLVLFYPSLLCHTYPSPSRLTTTFNPLLMFPIMLRCLNAYSNPGYKESCPRTWEDELEAGVPVRLEPLLSPLLIPTRDLAGFPKTLIFTTNLDPCLDECVTFVDKLHSVGVSVDMEVAEQLPHGYLNLCNLSSECHAAVETTLEKFSFAFDSAASMP